VIDSLPQLTTPKTAGNLYTAIRGSSSDGYNVDRERLLSWLCLKFRGFMLTARDGFLQVMTETAVLHGTTYGPGIYFGDNQNTSFNFAGSTGQSWRHSELGNMKVMLGCELAAYAPNPHGSKHMVTDEKRVLVRYVFLLPEITSPQRYHVESAMQVAFVMLRSGINNWAGWYGNFGRGDKASSQVRRL
jgi:hypothetical protein